MAEGSRSSALADVIAGGGIGLLLGTVVGMTTSEVVATVVGALTALLAVLLGLDGSDAAARSPVRANALRIGSLGLFTVLGLGLGLYVRINNPIALSPEAQMAKWQHTFPDDPTLAKQMMVYERTGIRPASFTYGKITPAEPVEVAVDEAKSKAVSGVLFSSLKDFDVCTRINPARYGSPEEVLAIYTRRGAPAILPGLRERIAAMPDESQQVAVAVTHDVLCALQREEERTQEATK
ncbi:MAG: hypothetical protein KDA73_17520 [Rhodobacteraceae bacterium]|nr:hypothetical protein [Paracoccaceae bacterium]